MTNINTLKQKLYDQKNKIGLVGGTVDVQEYDEMDHAIVAGISPKDWSTKVSIRKGFDPVKDSRQRAYARVKKIDDGLERMTLDVGLHECIHWEAPVDSGKGCPYNEYWHDKIVEAVKQNLPADKQNQASYVANAFEDAVINPRGREWRKGQDSNFSGQVLFWDWEGISCKEKGLEHFTPAYEAFVKLNMHLWGDNVDRALLKRHYANSEQVDTAVKNIVKDLGLQENTENTSYLFNKNKWKQMAGAFAKHMAPLLDQAPQERLSAYDSESEEGNGGQEGQEPSGNGIEQKVGTREGKEKIAFGRYASNETHSPNITSYEQLDSLYRTLARDIPVNVEAMTRQHSLQIAPLNYRAFDHEKDDPTKIKPSKIVLNGNGINFGVPNQPLTVVQKSKIQRKSFPDFKMVVLDNSRSMADSPDGSGNTGKTNFIPWGDNSKYHFALLGFYGIENFLQRQGVAQYINHGLLLFSSSTRYKEANFQGLDDVRKHALSPEWGSTRLDAKVLKDALKGRESFVLSISDGGLGNWDSTRNDFRTLAENNYFAHIQIGSGTSFTSDLESWRIPVFYVNSGKDLSKLMVNVTKDVYEKFTKQ